MSIELKIKGSVKSENIFKDQIQKENLVRVNWAHDWIWYVDLLREREKAIAELKKSSPKALAVGPVDVSDTRTVLPFPVTTNQDYGWLSTKNEFRLEVFGPYYENLKIKMNSSDAFSSVLNSSTEL